MKHEEKRKLQELGGSLYLSVPSVWINRFNLKKGSEMFIYTDDSGELHIFPEKKAEETEKVAVILYDKYFFRNLIKDYLFGRDVIKIRKNTPFTPDERNKIYAHVNNLLNLEIIEEEVNQITIQNLKSSLDINKMISRMYYLTKSMINDLTLGYKDTEILNSIIDRDKLVDRFYLAVIMQQRSLITSRWSRELSFVEILDLRLLVQKIEQIGDEIKNTANKILNKQNQKAIKIEDLKFLAEMYEKAYTAYIKHDTETAKKFWDMEKEDKMRLSYDEGLVRIYDNIKDITDLVI